MAASTLSFIITRNDRQFDSMMCLQMGERSQHTVVLSGRRDDMISGTNKTVDRGVQRGGSAAVKRDAIHVAGMNPCRDSTSTFG